MLPSCPGFSLELNATCPFQPAGLGPVCQDLDSVEEQVDLSQLLLDPRGKGFQPLPLAPVSCPHPSTLANTWYPSLVSCHWCTEGTGGRERAQWPGKTCLFSPGAQSSCTCSRAAGQVLVPWVSSTVTCLAPRAGWPLCTTLHPLPFPVSPARDHTNPHAH